MEMNLQITKLGKRGRFLVAAHGAALILTNQSCRTDMLMPSGNEEVTDLHGAPNSKILLMNSMMGYGIKLPNVTAAGLCVGVIMAEYGHCKYGGGGGVRLWFSLFR